MDWRLAPTAIGSVDEYDKNDNMAKLPRLSVPTAETVFRTLLAKHGARQGGRYPAQVYTTGHIRRWQSGQAVRRFSHGRRLGLCPNPYYTTCVVSTV